MILNPFTLPQSNFKIDINYMKSNYYYLDEKCIIAFITGYNNNYSTIIVPEEIIKNNYNIQLIYDGYAFGYVNKVNNLASINKTDSNMNFIIVQLLSE